MCLTPVLGFVKIGTHLMADRYAYLAQIGWFVVLVWTIRRWRWLTPGRQLALFALVAAGLLVFTYRQVGFWKDDLALATNGARVTGKNTVVCTGLGIGYDLLGEREQSLRCFREVLEHYFDYAGAHSNVARGYVLTGRPKRALVHLDLALRQSPREPRYHNLLAEVLAASPDPEIRDGAKAVEHAALACCLSRNRNPLYLDTRAAAHAEAGEFAQAVAMATRASQLAPSPEGAKLIRARIRLYSEGKPFRGILLPDAAVRRR